MACWAARRAMRVAGLERIGWTADALADADAGRPLPPSFTEQHGAAAFKRLLADPEMPHATVPLRYDPNAFGAGDVTEMPQSTAAFPALTAPATVDPLSAAVDACYSAAVAHGDDRASFCADAHRALD